MRLTKIIDRVFMKSSRLTGSAEAKGIVLVSYLTAKREGKSMLPYAEFHFPPPILVVDWETDH